MGQSFRIPLTFSSLLVSVSVSWALAWVTLTWVGVSLELAWVTLPAVDASWVLA